MKRKREEFELGQSIFALPNLESTLSLEAVGSKIFLSGNNVQPNEIGEVEVSISPSISTNAQKIIYNKFYWADDLFCFNYWNCGVGLAVAYLYRDPSVHNTENSNFSFIIYPIFLPRITLSSLQSCYSDDIGGRVMMINLLKSLAYYLNCGFSGLGIAPNGVGTTAYPEWLSGVGNNTDYPDSYYIPQWVAAKNIKGPLYARQNYPETYTTNCLQMPIFQVNEAPPLLWVVDEANLKLGIKINNNFSKFGGLPESTCYIGCQLVALEKYFCDAPMVSVPLPVKYITSLLFYNTFSLTKTLDILVTSPYGENAGWFNNGVFATGFGNPSSKYASSGGQLIKAAGDYGDIYTDSERLTLWNNTVFPDAVNSGLSIKAFADFCDSFKLIHNASSTSSQAVFSTYSPLFLPTRFLCINSDSLSVTQQRSVLSNNPAVATNTIGVFFLTFNSKRKWKDETVSGKANRSVKRLPGSSTYSKVSSSDSTVIGLETRRAIQNVDLVVVDEWKNVIQNYGVITRLSPTTAQNFFYMLYEWRGKIPNSMSYPIWLQALSPYSTMTPSSFEPIFMVENWFTSIYMFMSIKNSQFSASIVLDDSFNPQTTSASSIIHYSRIMGF